MASPILLEGTTLEGGGQLLRIALGVSALTAIPISITNIRGKRSGGGGLKAQHLTSAIWLGKGCNARISGAGLKSKNLDFVPCASGKESMIDFHQRQTSDGKTVLSIEIKQGSPGSIGLILQAILPFLIFSGSSISPSASLEPIPLDIRITGGTNASMSPSHDYIAQVLLPTLSLIGLSPITATLHSRGWTQGCSKIGSASFAITPLTPGSVLPAFELKVRGPIVRVKVTIIAPKDFEQDIREELDLALDNKADEIFGDREPDIETIFEDSKHEKRYYLLLVATSSNGYKLGSDWLYDLGIRPGKTAVVISGLVKRVVGELVKEIKHGGCVDEYLRDQLVVFQALAKGKSSVNGGRDAREEMVEPSLHTKTAEWVCGEVLGVKFDGIGGCEGVGLRAGEVYAERTQMLLDATERLQI